MATGSPPTKLRSYPPMKMVLVEALGSSDDKNGMSLAGIKSYVAQTYPDLAEKSNFKTILKRCILKGLETGDLARSKKSQDYAGVQGKFKLATKSEKAEARPKPKTAKRRSRSVSPNQKAAKPKKSSSDPSKKPKASKPKSRSTSPAKASESKAKKHPTARSVSPGTKKAKSASQSRSRSRSPTKPPTKMNAKIVPNGTGAMKTQKTSSPKKAPSAKSVKNKSPGAKSPKAKPKTKAVAKKKAA